MPFMNAVVSSSRPDVRRTPPVTQTVCQTFTVNLMHGLHARPCAMLVKRLQPFRCSIEVEVNGERASGKSILGLMSLGAGPGSEIRFHMTGEDVFLAMAEVEELFSSNFGSAHGAR